jgi:hypothetical protein
VRVDERSHRRERSGVGPQDELIGDQGDGVVVAERGEGRVERVRQDARLHAIVDDVGEDVAVDGVALSEEGKARVQRQRAVEERLLADDVARDALFAIGAVDDGLGHDLVG